jgi:hypothetical protein
MIEEVPANYDLWAELLVFKVFMEYHCAAGDVRAFQALEEGLAFIYVQKPQPWLIDLALKIQAQGFDWGEFFKRWPCKEPTPKGRWSYMRYGCTNLRIAEFPVLARNEG